MVHKELTFEANVCTEFAKYAPAKEAVQPFGDKQPPETETSHHHYQNDLKSGCGVHDEARRDCKAVPLEQVGESNCLQVLHDCVNPR